MFRKQITAIISTNRKEKNEMTATTKYIVKKMSDSRWLLHFKQAINGQQITAELTRCTASKTQKAMWKTKTATGRVPSTYWNVKTEVCDAQGVIHSWYNPTVKYVHYENKVTHHSISRDETYTKTINGTDCNINFDWLLEATEENEQKILAEIERMATEGIKTLC